MTTVRAKNDLTGLRFGRLVVVAFERRENRPAQTRLYWRCKCDCGTDSIAISGKLLQGRKKSCGRCEKPGGARGEWPGYSSLKGAIGRCYNEHNTAFRDYGARGVTVCDRWRFGEGEKTGFECFFEDMGPRPPGKTLDRIDVDGAYAPANCRWATKKEQQQNQRRAIYAEIGGVQVPLKKYTRRLGLCYETIRNLVRNHGLTVGDAARGYFKRRAA